MKFGQALEACETGLRIAREGWNGKDQFVYRKTGVSWSEQIGETAWR
jgi:hypothetical protein